MLIETTHEIEAPVSAVWQVFGEQFGDIADWAKMIRKSNLDGPLQTGSVRTCELSSGPITEELTRFDREHTALTYVIRSGLPGMVKLAENAWDLEALGATRTRVTSTITMNLAWWAAPLSPVIKKQFSATMQSMMRQLDRRVVEGAGSGA